MGYIHIQIDHGVRADLAQMLADRRQEDFHVGVGGGREVQCAPSLASSIGATGSIRPWTLASLLLVVVGEPTKVAAAWPSTKIENKFKEARIKRPSEHDQVLPGLQVPSAACRREGPDLRSAP